MTTLKSISTPTETNLLIAFSDLTLFSKYARAHSDRELFDLMSEYAEFVGDVIEGAGGIVLKFIGDAVLIVFPEDTVDPGVQALRKLKDEGDAWMKDRGIPCRHVIKAHFGPVICGRIGIKSEKRLDIFGHNVNIAATLKSSGIAVSPQVFRKLEPETRKQFKKHTPPVTYIPVEESH